MTRIGIVGFGYMGRMHYHQWRKLPDIRIAAVFDPRPSEEVHKPAGGNIAGAEGEIPWDTIRLFNDFPSFLRESGVEALSLTVPNFLHADYAVAALENGCHVLCEKPMALDVPSCDRMRAAARQNGRILQVAHCIRFWPEYAAARAMVREGRFGPLLAASFRRLGAPPGWSGWFADETRSGGLVLDLHVHDSDYIQDLLGMPAAVQTIMNPSRRFIATHYIYSDGPSVLAEGSWCMTPSFGFEMSFNLMFENATVVYDGTRQPSFRVCPREGSVFMPTLEPGDGYEREIAHFARILRGEPVDPVVSSWQSRESVRLALAEKESAARGQPITIEPQEES